MVRLVDNRFRVIVSPDNIGVVSDASDAGMGKQIFDLLHSYTGNFCGQHVVDNQPYFACVKTDLVKWRIVFRPC